jgi:hypothetical protein
LLPLLDGLSVVLPARDEAASIGGVVERALLAAPGVARDFEILVVDDGSRDGTSAAAAEASRGDPRVRCVRHGSPRGYGAALRTGFAEARHPVVAWCDGDGQFDPGDLAILLEPLRRGEAEVVTGRRAARADPAHRLLLGRTWSTLVRGAFGIEVRDVNCGFKALPAALARRLDLRSDGGFVCAEMLGKLSSAGIPVAERPVRHFPRTAGSPTGARPGVALGAVLDFLRLGSSVARFGPPCPGPSPLARLLPAPRPLAWALTALLVVLFGAATALLSKDGMVDFNTYYLAAHGLRRGMDVYGARREDWAPLAGELGVAEFADPYRYPPLTAVLVLPLTPLGPRAAAAVFTALSCASMIGAAWAIGGALRSRYGVPVALAAVATFVPVLTTLYCGQVGGFLLLSLALGLRSLVKGTGTGAGAALAAGAHLKMLPLAHIAWLGWSRRWRPFAAGLAFLGLLAAASAAVAGPGPWSSFLRNLPRLSMAGSPAPHPSNQALGGVLARLLPPLGAGDDAVRITWQAAALLLAGATALLCRGRTGRGGPTEVEFSLVTVACCLVTPYAWFHQLLLLLVPCLVLADRSLRGAGGRWTLEFLAALWIAFALFGFAWRQLAAVPLGHSLPALFALALFALLARELRAGGRGVAA